MKEFFKNRWKTILYNIVIFFALFGGFEWYLNVKMNNPSSAPKWLSSALRNYYHEQDCNNIQQDPICARYDATLFYTLRPGTFEFGNREFNNTYRVNSKGVRDDEESLEYPKVIVLGDSYAMGWGVEQDETFASLLESRMGVKVLNTGISSYGTAREITALEKFKTDSVEYVIIQYCPNDRIENQHWVQALNQLHISSEEVYNASSRVQAERNRYYFLKHTLNIPRYLGGKKKNPAPQPKVITDSLKLIGTTNAFLSILKSSKKIPKSAKLIVFSIEAERANNTFITDVKSMLDKEFASSLHDRMSYIDFTGKLHNDQHRYVLDPHLNAKGHEVIANQIYEHIHTLDFSMKQKVWYYDTGDTCIVSDYKNGLKEGTFKAYWENNMLSMIAHYKKGIKEGKEQFFDEQGKITLEHSYVNGKLEGWEFVFGADGSEKARNFYRGGEKDEE